jgi:hypothetical protein
LDITATSNVKALRSVAELLAIANKVIMIGGREFITLALNNGVDRGCFYGANMEVTVTTTVVDGSNGDAKAGRLYAEF